MFFLFQKKYLGSWGQENRQQITERLRATTRHTRHSGRKDFLENPEVAGICGTFGEFWSF